MAVLKKLRASTLMETLVATILIVVIFMLSSMLLNSLLINTNKYNDDIVKQELLLLQYQYKNGVLHLPYYSDLEHWEIEVVKEQSNAMSGILFVALHSETQKEISYRIIDE